MHSNNEIQPGNEDFFSKHGWKGFYALTIAIALLSVGPDSQKGFGANAPTKADIAALHTQAALDRANEEQLKKNRADPMADMASIAGW